MNVRLLSFLLLCAAPAVVTAQSLERSVISAYGASGSNGSIAVDMTVGEVATTTISAGTITLTQGFQQPDAAGTSSSAPLPIAILGYRLYPNPAHTQLTVELESVQALRLQLQIMDARGRLVMVNPDLLDLTTGQGEATLDISALAEGSYLIRLTDANAQLRGTLRFQKQ